MWSSCRGSPPAGRGLSRVRSDRCIGVGLASRRRASMRASAATPSRRHCVVRARSAMCPLTSWASRRASLHVEHRPPEPACRRAHAAPPSVPEPTLRADLCRSPLALRRRPQQGSGRRQALLADAQPRHRGPAGRVDHRCQGGSVPVGHGPTSAGGDRSHAGLGVPLSRRGLRLGQDGS